MGSVPPSPALPSLERKGDCEGRGEVGTLLARAESLSQGRGAGWQRLGSGSVPTGTALPARKWAGKRRDPAGTLRSQLALLRCLGSPAESPGMRWLWVVALVAPACTVPYNGTAGSTGHGDNGDRGPCTPQHGSLGTEVLLLCPGGEAEWRRGDTVLGTSPAPGLALPNASLAHEGHYSCHHPVTGETWATICLRLGYPPPPPAIECWATSYPQAVNCSWGLSPDPLLDTDFVATFRHGTDTGECTLTGPRSCSFGDLQVFSLTPYELNVTARNALGAASGALPFLLENIIKPDPPEALRVSPIPGEPQKLLLEWSPPSSWPFPEYFPLHYRIRYSRDNDSVPTTVGPYELTSHTLTDLEPGSLHHIQVAAKDITDSGEFSAWSPPASGTPWVGL